MARKKKDEIIEVKEEIKEQPEKEEVQEEPVKKPEPVIEKPVVQPQPEQRKRAVNISGAVKQYTKPDPRNVYCAGYIKEGNYVVDEEIPTLNGKFLKLSNGLYVLAASGNITYIR